MAEKINTVEKNVSYLMGLPIEEVKAMSTTEIRCHIEKNKKSKMTLISAFPVIGRGNVLGSSLITTDELNADIDKILNRRTA